MPFCTNIDSKKEEEENQGSKHPFDSKRDFQLEMKASESIYTYSSIKNERDAEIKLDEKPKIKSTKEDDEDVDDIDDDIDEEDDEAEAEADENTESDEKIKNEQNDDDDKKALPSIKATQKDRSKSASIIQNQPKMKLLLEILRLLELYKAHSSENKFQQWGMVQDALSREEIGSRYRRMDKSYCFRKKVLNAIDSWIGWAKIRGYPDPSVLRRYQRNTLKLPGFLELLYKIHNEIKDSENMHLNRAQIYNSNGRKEDGNKSNDDISTISLSKCPQCKDKSPMPNHVSKFDIHEMDTDDISDSMPINPMIQAMRSTAGASLAIESALNQNFHPEHMTEYVKYATSSQQIKTEILRMKRSAIQAELDDRDLIRLENIEAKLSTTDSNSALHKAYKQQRDRCIARLERS